MMKFSGNKYFLALFTITSICSCTLGPDFTRPAPLPVTSYTNTFQESENNLHYVYNSKVPAEWWQLFSSPQINSMITEALKNNQNLTSLRATLRQAQANYKAVSGAELPQISANAGATATRFAPQAYGFTGGNFPTTDFVLYNITADVSYNLDIFGGLKRQTEASAAYAEYEEYELRAAELTLSANIITAVFKLAMLNQQIDITKSTISAQESILKTAKQQQLIGGIATFDVNNLEKNLLLTKANLPQQIKTLQLLQHQLAVYMGKAPAQIANTDYKLNEFNMIQNIPIVIPAKLAYQRPDILAAEALFHQSSAQVGVATANLYPSFNISGSGGPIATQQNWTSFSGQAWIWSVGPAVNLPIFNGGTLRAEKKAAEEAFYAAQANYKQTVLQGLQNVADCLSALDQDSAILVTQKKYYDKSLTNLDIGNKQFKSGGISHTQLLNLQILANEASVTLLQAQANRLADTAALFQALGGGWW